MSTASTADTSVRAAEPGDYEALQRMMSDPEGYGSTLQLPFTSVETWRKKLADKPEGLHSLVACVPEAGVVGSLAVEASARFRRRHVGVIGMSVHREWRGRGVGTALMTAAVHLAENWLGLTRLELTVFTDNAAAIALYRKFGFVVEGTMRRYALRDGRYVDSHAMARLRVEG
jgi:putative acetyltransferase